MPVGNSITWGRDGDDLTQTEGYRGKLYDYLAKAGFDFEFVGPQNGSQPWDYYLALPGRKIEAFLPGGELDVEVALNNHSPNMILLHVGTNNHIGTDTHAPYENPQTASGKLRQLIDIMLRYPSVEHVLVCKIIPRQDQLGGDWVKTYNTEIERMFYDLYSNDDRVIVLDMNSFISASNGALGADYLHPTQLGYRYMAQKYEFVVEQMDEQDTSRPSQVTWNSGEALDSQSAYLNWWAPGDDGNSGRANLYELRYATYELNQSNFNTGELISIPHPGGAGAEEELTVSGLLPDQTYFFAIRAYDERNNAGAVSDNMIIDIGAGGGFVYSDDFCDPQLPTWSFDPAIYQASDCLFHRLGSGWPSPAIYTDASYNIQAPYVEANMSWSDAAPIDGIRASGIAMLLDNDDYNAANGYFVYVRDSKIHLYGIENGALNTSNKIDGDSFDDAALNPGPGDSLQVRWTQSGNMGHVFSVKVNNAHIGQVSDPQKMYGNAETMYSGIIMYSDAAADRFSVEIPPLQPERLRIYSGDNQHARINTSLANPLAVKVEDINGVGVSGLMIDFSVISGDASLSTDDVVNFSGNIAVEAETGVLDAPMTTSSDAAASNGKYIFAPYASENYEQGLARYSVYVPTAGTFYIHLRYKAEADNSNSIYLTAPGIDKKYVKFGMTSEWYWHVLSSTTYLQQGFNEIIIYNREPLTKIDKLVLSNNPSYSPVDKGPDPQQYDFITDRNGLARTEVTLGQTAGPVKIQAEALSLTANRVDTFTVYADPGEPVSMIAASDNAIEGTTGQTLPEPFQVEIRDQYGNLCDSRVKVKFEIISGDGTFGGDLEKTIPCVDGIAEALLTLGWEAETQVEATVVDYPLLGRILFKGFSGTVPYQVVKLPGGDNQSGEVKTKLPNPLEVKVLDNEGGPVLGYQVPFEVISGEGNLNSQSSSIVVPTDSMGIASVEYSLGDTAGVALHKVEVNVPLEGAPLHFTADAEPAAPQQIVIVQGNQQQQHAGQTFTTPLRTRVVDVYGNGIAGHQVKFSVLVGDGNFRGLHGVSMSSQDTTLTTNDLGFTQIGYTAGRQEGRHQVGAEAIPAIPQSSRIFTELDVLPSAPHYIVKQAGDNQTGQVGQMFGQVLKIRVNDPFGEHVSMGIKVRFSIKLFGDAQQSGQIFTTQTNENGEAIAQMNIPTVSGGHEIWVTLPDHPQVSKNTFRFTATPAAAAKLLAYSDTTFTGMAGNDGQTLAVTVQDQWNNPTPNHTVTFTVQNGNGHFPNDLTSLAVKSDSATGIAEIEYTMGTDTDIENVIRAGSIDYGGRPLENNGLLFTGTVLPNHPAALFTQSGDNQTDVILTTLDDSLVVELRDAYGNVVPNQDVRFEAMNPEGRINGNPSNIQATDAAGRAAVAYTLGSRAGIASDSIRVTTPNWQEIDPLFFTASANPGSPHRMFAAGDSTWTLQLGAAGVTLNPAVRLVDAYQNAIPNHPVHFEVSGGSGTLANGLDSITVESNADGIASVDWELSTLPEIQALQATSAFNDAALANSPVHFTASTLTGAPHALHLPALQDTAVANHPMAPISVQVVDTWQNPIAGHNVMFRISTPDDGVRGHFDVDGNTVQQTTVETDSSGFASVHFTPILGWNGITVRAYGDNGRALKNSGQEIMILGERSNASQIEILTDKRPVLQAGETVAVRVAAYDTAGYPVDGHSIYFEILDNTGSLANAQPPYPNYSTVKTRAGLGIAEEFWTVGANAGEQDTLIVNGGFVQGSPDSIIATIQPGAPFADSSSITAGGYIKADSTTFSTITVTLADSFGNPIPNLSVQLTSQEPGVYPELINQKTNVMGKVSARVRATQAGPIHIGAIVEEYPEFELCCAELEVLPGNAAQILIADGFQANVRANKGAVIKDSLAVVAMDKYGNPAPGSWVYYELKNGSGSFLESGAKTCSKQTDADGMAGAHLIVGADQIDTYHVSARIDNGEQVNFIVTSQNPAPPYQMAIVSGDSLEAAVGDSLPEPFTVGIVDRDGIPVFDQPVFFENQDGTSDGLLSSNPVTSDRLGQAKMHYRLGQRSGVYRIRAYIVGTDQEVLFSAFATAGGAARLAFGSNPEPVKRVRDQVLLTVLSQDENGNNVGGVPLQFSLQSEPEQENGAQFVRRDTVSNSNGVAEARLELGEKIGDYFVRVTSSSLGAEPLVFTITGAPDVPDRMVKLERSDQQYMTFNRELVYPVTIRLLDQYGNPVSGTNPATGRQEGYVDFQPVPGSGRLVYPNRVYSDSLGFASNCWIIGNQVENKLWVQRLGLSQNYVEFVAYGVENAFPEFIDMPSDTTILYGQPFSLPIKAQDDDGDPLTYQAYDAPLGSSLNQSSKIFSWTPLPTQRGLYVVTFRVEDDKTGDEKGFDVDSVRINVTSQIRIWSREPQTAPVIERPNTQRFSVLITDNVTNDITYNWYVNGEKQPVNQSSYVFDSMQHGRGDFHIKVVVSDGVGQDSTEWSTVVTSMELVSFEGTAHPYKGVQLNWQTRNESKNLGFNILRSQSPDGPYKQANTRLIPSAGDGQYTFIDSTAQAGRRNYYRLQDISTSGQRNTSQRIEVMLELPSKYELHQNYPNPFNPATTIRFEMPESGQVRLMVFNIQGQQVRDLMNRPMPAGYHTIVWDGRNDLGSRVASGVYYYRIVVGDFNKSRKMLVLK